MPEPVKIDTGKYTKEGKVDIDGNIWTVVLPGAARELQFSKNNRRMDFLSNKVEKQTATEEDLDKLDLLEDYALEFFKGIFRDDTKDNSKVGAWVDATPIAIIAAAFNDIKKAAEERDVNG